MSPFSRVDFARFESSFAWSLASAVLCLLMLWFGAIAVLSPGHDPLAPLMSAGASGVVRAGLALGVIQLVLGVAMLRPWPAPWRAAAALATAVYWWSTLLLLMAPAAWVQAAPYGGFPYIDGGQGVLKHVVLGAIGLGLWARDSRNGPALRLSRWLLWGGQLLVLGWLGAMKFTHHEAEGVETLVRASPLFAWLYRMLDMRTASSLIGSMELAAAALIAVWPWRPRVAAIGLRLLIVGELVASALILTGVAWTADGAPLAGDAIVILAKNFGLMAGALVLLARPALRATTATASMRA